MCTGDLLAVRFFLLPADHDRCSSDCTLKYTFNFVLNIRRLENNTADFFSDSARSAKSSILITKK